MNLWIKNGILVDPSSEKIKKRDIIIERGKIAKILPHGRFKGNSDRIRTIDADGRYIVPGLIDMHVHLREPGYEYKETIESGSRAGVSGGFTAIACMPNTEPVNDNSAVSRFILKQAKEANLLNVYPIGAITKGQRGEVLTEFGDLKNAGVVGVSDDGRPVPSSEVMRRAMEYANYYNLTVISHCEDITLSSGGQINEGLISTRIGLKGIPAQSEEIMVYRDIALSRLIGAPVHIAHVSTKESVELIKRAKEMGLPVTAETAPHYFTLDHSATETYDTNTKMNPPLRTPEDVEAIKKALEEDVIDVIATDHAPHSPLEKEVEFDKAEFGIIGLETALPLTLNLVREGVLSLPRAMKKLSTNPAKILGIPGGSIKEGAPADISIIDLDYEYTLKEEDIQSKSKNTPFLNHIMKGICLVTIVGGRVVWKRKI